MTLDALARRENVRVEKVQLKSAVARCSVAGQRVLLAKPLTYMNLCGESIIKLAKFYKVEPFARLCHSSATLRGMLSSSLMKTLTLHFTELLIAFITLPRQYSRETTFPPQISHVSSGVY